MYVTLAILPFLYNPWWRIALNWTHSVPATLFVIVFGEQAEKGDYVALRWEGVSIAGHHPGDIFVKRLVGLPGDVVTREDRDFRVSGAYVGRAKPFSGEGVALDLGPLGVLPAGHYYVAGAHADSFDSRYALFGWLEESRIVAKAYAIF